MSLISKMNLATRNQLTKERELLDKKAKELYVEEERLKRKTKEVDRLKQKYEALVKQLQDQSKEATQRQTRNTMLEYQTEVNKSHKGKLDYLKLNRTVDQQNDISAMYSSQDKHIDTSIKYYHRFSGLNAQNDDKENINTSN